ncbi:MAG TPA: hypothetical protein DD379_21775 [Cyanobacteria bacterium UBA11162]|nr:hypothetical protein [Cyanobacteria bacterium UBA11162]
MIQRLSKVTKSLTLTAKLSVLFGVGNRKMGNGKWGIENGEGAIEGCTQGKDSIFESGTAFCKLQWVYTVPE